ncbi:MAG: FixH family protein, partial [Candidatus Limnocylindria bacterium]
AMTRRERNAMSGFAAVILVVTLHAGCALAGEPSSPPATPDPDPTSTPSTDPGLESPSASAAATPAPNVREGVLSEEALFVGSWISDLAIPPINVVHEWVLHIETPEGEAIEGAIVSLNGDMPAHGHGMPTQPQVSADLGGGDYRVEGMSFQMGGYWIIDVMVTAGGQTDLIRFGLEL